MTNEIKINGCKFNKHGIRVGGQYFPAYFSHGELTNGSVCVSIYAKSILKGLPAQLSPKNDSDSQTDYHESDKVYFMRGTPEYDMLLPICR